MRDGTIAAAGMVALAVAMGIGRFAFTPILPMMQEDAGVSVAAGGWLASANYVGYFVGALSATRLRLSAPATIRGALVIIGLATVAMGFTGNVMLWLLLRAVAAWRVPGCSSTSRPGASSASRPPRGPR